MNVIDPSAQIGESTTIGHFSVVEKGAIIGKNVTIGNHVTVHAGTEIGDDVTVADGAVLGKPPKPAKTSTVKLNDTLPPLKIGNGVTVGVNSVVYRGSSIGNDAFIADLASIREDAEVGDLVVIGRGVTIENHVKIGERTKIQSNAYITAYTELEEQVFIAPCVTTTNDNFMGRTEERFSKIKGATIKKGARVGGGAIILPGITIAEETFVAAGALVTKDTTAGTVVKGLPAKFSGAVDKRELLEKIRQQDS